MKNYKHISDIIEFHGSKNYLKPPRGCSDAEIDILEAKLKVNFPEAYREYLSWMGKDHFGLLIGSDAFFEHVADNTECLDEVLEEEGLEHFKSGRFVCFFSHQGYVLYWFYETDQANPVCYEYIETLEGLKFGPTLKFTDLILRELKGMATAKESTISRNKKTSRNVIEKLFGLKSN